MLGDGRIPGNSMTNTEQYRMRSYMYWIAICITLEMHAEVCPEDLKVEPETTKAMEGTVKCMLFDLCPERESWIWHWAVSTNSVGVQLEIAIQTVEKNSLAVAIPVSFDV